VPFLPWGVRVQMDTGISGEGAFRPPPPLPEGIKKDVLKEPEDSALFKKPKTGDELKVHYVGTLEDGTQFDSSRDRGEPITFTLGKGQVIKGWDLAFATMRKGELSRITIPPEYAYGEAGSPPAIPPKAVLTFEVELISWVAIDDVFGDGNAEKSRLQDGEGWNNPKKGQEVCVSVKATAQDGSVIVESKSQDYTLGSESLGELSVLADKVLSDMLKGERCSIACIKDYLYKGSAHGEVKVEFVLEEMYEISDVSFLSDDSVMKKIVKEGEGHETPKDSANVTLTVQAAVDAKGAALPGFVGQKELNFMLGGGEVSDAVEAAAAQMKKGERALVTCTKPSACCDERLGLKDISADKVVLTLEMIDFKKGIDSERWNMGPEEKVIIASMKKDGGAKLFKAKRFELALQKYKGVTEMLSSLDNFSNEQKEEANELKGASELNKAACYLQLGDPTSALSTCNGILKTDRHNVKALFRRAKAHYERGEHVEAEKDLIRVSELDSSNTDAKNLLAHVKRAQKVADKASKATFAKMCDGFGKIGSGREKDNKQPEKKEEPKEQEYVTPKDKVNVTFRVEHKTQEGELVRVVGSTEALGVWEFDKGIPMRRTAPKQDWDAISRGKAPVESHIWEGTLELSEADGRTEYRYAVRGPGGDRLEAGDKHILQLSSMGGSRMTSRDEWRN